jgi:hypothetical protein
MFCLIQRRFGCSRTKRYARSKRTERLRRRTARIPRRQHQQPPFALPPNEHEPIIRRSLGLPSVTLEALDRSRHCPGEVRTGLQALTVDNMPVQIPQHDPARRDGCGEGGEGVAAHLADCREGQALASIQFEGSADTVYVALRVRAAAQRCVLLRFGDPVRLRSWGCRLLGIASQSLQESAPEADDRRSYT